MLMMLRKCVALSSSATITPTQAMWARLIIRIPQAARARVHVFVDSARVMSCDSMATRQHALPFV
jgi:hypothetical protein